MFKFLASLCSFVCGYSNCGFLVCVRCPIHLIKIVINFFICRIANRLKVAESLSHRSVNIRKATIGEKVDGSKMSNRTLKKVFI